MAMRIILAAMGTLGDHLPLVGLGASLAARGLPVQVACNPAMHPLVLRAALSPMSLGAPLDPSRAQACAQGWDHRNLQEVEALPWSEGWDQLFRTHVQQLLEILQPGDLLCSTANLPFASLAAQAVGCGWVSIGLNTGAMIDYGRLVDRYPMHPWRQGKQRLEQALREEMDLGDPCGGGDLQPRLRLHAVPPAFVPSNYPQMQAVRTGFWSYADHGWTDGPLEAELGSLIQRRTPFLVMAFSSQPLVNPLDVLDQHLQVAEALQMPLVLVRGWAFDGLPLPDHPLLLPLEAISFRFLFRHAAAVFTHGGMGTLAEALQAGCALVVEPFGNDQFMNTALLVRQGLALGIARDRFEPQAVAQLLREQLRQHRCPRLPSGWFEGLSVAVDALVPIVDG